MRFLPNSFAEAFLGKVTFLKNPYQFFNWRLTFSHLTLLSKVILQTSCFQIFCEILFLAARPIIKCLSSHTFCVCEDWGRPKLDDRRWNGNPSKDRRPKYFCAIAVKAISLTSWTQWTRDYYFLYHHTRSLRKWYDAATTILLHIASFLSHALSKEGTYRFLLAGLLLRLVCPRFLWMLPFRQKLTLRSKKRGEISPLCSRSHT